MLPFPRETHANQEKTQAAHTHTHTHIVTHTVTVVLCATHERRLIERQLGRSKNQLHIQGLTTALFLCHYLIRDLQTLPKTGSSSKWRIPFISKFLFLVSVLQCCKMCTFRCRHAALFAQLKWCQAIRRPPQRHST